MLKVMFLCTGNSCRSQIAEAFARIHGRDVIEPYSSGSRPSGTVNPKAIVSMAQIGYDLSTHNSKSLSDIPDPKDMDAEGFRKVREMIEEKVKKPISPKNKNPTLILSVRHIVFSVTPQFHHLFQCYRFKEFV